jgi:tRNA (cytidine/uridine-2'-O-)-methyltransferase
MISIALNEPEIPQNTGNIARLCVGLDIPLILIGKLGFSLTDKYLKRAGLDYWQYLNLTNYKSIEDFLSKTPHHRKVLASTKVDTPYYKFQYLSNDIIVFGSESKGLPEQFIKNNIENAITIPMVGMVRSLNLSNSASIIAYHSLLTLNYF